MYIAPCYFFFDFTLLLVEEAHHFVEEMYLSKFVAVAAVLPSVLAGTLSFDKSKPAATFDYSTDTPGAKNWIGIYNYYNGGPENETYVAPSLTWAYAPKAAGSVQVDVSKLGEGRFKAYYLLNDGYKWLADPIDFNLATGPVKFLISEFTTHNARQGDAFEANVSGLVSNAGDDTNKFTKLSGASWATVSPEGVIKGTPGVDAQTDSVTVQVKATDGSTATLEVEIPVVRKGGRLVSTLRVMSFNMWHGGTHVTDYHRKQLEFLTSKQVDVVGLQESFGGHAIRLAKALGWEYFQSSDVGIISRYPIVEIYPEAQAAGSVRIALDGEETQIILWNAHLGYTPYGPYDFCYYNMTQDQVFKREIQSGRTPQIKEIVSKMQIDNANNVPVLLTGDFNAPSHLDWTERNKAAHCGVGYVPWPSSIEPVKAGLVDSFRQLHPDEVKVPAITWSPIYLYNDGEKAPEPLDRIDFVYYKGKALRAVKSEILVVGNPTPEPNHQNNEWTSDHAVVMTTFKVGCGKK